MANTFNFFNPSDYVIPDDDEFDFDVQHDVSILQARSKKIESHLAVHDKQLKAYAKQNASFKAWKKADGDRIKILETAVTDKDGAIERLEGVVTEKDGKIDTLEASVTKEKERAENLNGQLQTANASINTFKTITPAFWERADVLEKGQHAAQVSDTAAQKQLADRKKATANDEELISFIPPLLLHFSKNGRKKATNISADRLHRIQQLMKDRNGEEEVAASTELDAPEPPKKPGRKSKAKKAAQATTEAPEPSKSNDHVQGSAMFELRLFTFRPHDVRQAPFNLRNYRPNFRATKQLEVSKITSYQAISEQISSMCAQLKLDTSGCTVSYKTVSASLSSGRVSENLPPISMEQGVIAWVQNVHKAYADENTANVPCLQAFVYPQAIRLEAMSALRMGW